MGWYHPYLTTSYYNTASVTPVLKCRGRSQNWIYWIGEDIARSYTSDHPKEPRKQGYANSSVWDRNGVVSWKIWHHNTPRDVSHLYWNVTAGNKLGCIGPEEADPIRNIPSENDRKTNFRCSLNNEELDELCTQHRFEPWSQRLKRIEVWQKPVSAKSAKRTALMGFC